jgi:hypothetical protein
MFTGDFYDFPLRGALKIKNELTVRPDLGLTATVRDECAIDPTIAPAIQELPSS